MAQGDGNPGMNHLAKALDDQMKRYHDRLARDVKIEFGRIGSGLSLTPFSFSYALPPSEYYVGKNLIGTTGNLLIAPGDTVIIAWVQNDICVLDRVVRASAAVT